MVFSKFTPFSCFTPIFPFFVLTFSAQLALPYTIYAIAISGQDNRTRQGTHLGISLLINYDCPRAMGFIWIELTRSNSNGIGDA